MNIPIYIICFNNGWLVENTINQLSRFKHKIFVVDNASTSFRTRSILRQLESSGLCEVIRVQKNHGHKVLWQEEIYSTLPQYFALTDPDLSYSPQLPDNFIEVLADLTNMHNACKAGLALEVPSEEETYSCLYYEGKNIRDWEMQFWHERLPHPNLDVYFAPIDTTFAVYNKEIKNDRCCRVAGVYTARHSPWYISQNDEIPLIDIVETYSATTCSTISKIILDEFQRKHPNLHFLKKNKLTMLVECDGSEAREGFWKNHYPNWEPDTFHVFDQYADENHTAIDIGSWIGPTVLYLAQKCRHVISVEADRDAARTLKQNIKHNHLENKVTAIEKAIYRDNSGVWFGPNIFRENDGLNASTSQIATENNNDKNYLVPTITWPDVVSHLLPNETVCLIKVDIEGGEQFILRDVLEWAYKHYTPAYISFHYSWWRKQNLEQFQDLFDLFGMPNLLEQIQTDPFISIMFERKKTHLFKLRKKWANSLYKRKACLLKMLAAN